MKGEAGIIGDITVAVGVGATGIPIATALPNGPEHRVWVVASSEESAIALRNGGIRRSGIFGSACMQSGSFEAYGGIRALPYGQTVGRILITVKATAIEALVQSLRERQDLIDENTVIVLFQNGLGFERSLLELVKSKQIYRGIVALGAHRESPNTAMVSANFGGITFGPSQEGASMVPAERLARELNTGGIPSSADAEISKVISEKALFNVSVNACSALFHRTLGELVDARDSHMFIDCAMEEAWCALHRDGLRTRFGTLDEYRERFYTFLIPQCREHVSSLAQDLGNSRPTEIDYLNGAICAMARGQGWRAGMNQFLTESIHEMEQSRDYHLSPLLSVA